MPWPVSTALPEPVWQTTIAMRTDTEGHDPYGQKATGAPAITCRRGDIYYANLNPVIGSEQGGLRPVLILQNDRGNRFSRTTIVAAITSRIGKKRLPTHVELPAARYQLDRDSVVLLEQIRTIDQRRLKNRIGRLDDDGFRELERALCASLGMRPMGTDVAPIASPITSSKEIRTSP